MRTTSRRSVLLHRVGVLLVLVGLALGGYVTWQMWGTSVLAERTHRTLVEDVRREWERPSSERAPRSASTVPNGVGTEHGVVSAIVRIPRFGDDYAVPVLEGTSDRVLAAGFGRFTGGATAGAEGNFALAAHRVTHGEPLRDMPRLEPGDTVVIETRAWAFTYVLDSGGDELIVPFTDGWVLDPVPQNPDGGVQPRQQSGQRLLTLTTCSELFHTDRRLVAFGHLVSREPVGDDSNG